MINNTITRLLVKGLLVVVGAAIGGFLFLLFAVLYVGEPLTDAVISSHGFLFNSEPIDLTATQTIVLEALVAQGHILPIESYIGQISSYYGTIINVLIVVIGLISGAAFLYIRAVSKIDAEEIVSSAAVEASKTYFGSTEFSGSVSKMVRECVEREKEVGSLSFEIGEFRGMLDQLAAAEESLAQAEDRIVERVLESIAAQQDTSEGDEGDRVLGEADGEEAEGAVPDEADERQD
jgi:hypothetical protein